MTEPYTKEEVREMFLDHCRYMAFYWSKRDVTSREMCEGVVFSVLTAIDGVAGGFPSAITLVMDPHPDDEEYRISNGDRWIQPGQAINDDVMLHDCFYVAPKENAGQ